MMTSQFGKRLLAPIAACGLAALLAGCVVYPDGGGPDYGGIAPAYAGYGGYGGVTAVTVYAPGRAYEGSGRYHGSEHHGDGGWREGSHQAGGGGHAETPRRREHGTGG